MLTVATAGWAIPRDLAERFPGTDARLERYARVLDGVEINSSFKQAHRPATYRRWAASTPAGFRFAVKLPHEITHARRLVGVVDPLERFLAAAAELGDRCGPLLVQLPGSLAFDPRSVQTFLAVLRRRWDGPVVCEPRHASWTTPAADRLFERHRVTRVAADPPRAPGDALPGGWLGDAMQPATAYFRWHGSPVVYRSSYDDERLAAWAATVRAWAARVGRVWCVFDNTTFGAATANALDFGARLGDLARPVARADAAQ